MIKLISCILLFTLYAGYSALVYTRGTESPLAFAPEEQQKIQDGKQLYQQKNCQACHQLYGLGGYLGPELTTAYSDKNSGERFIRAMLKAGGNRMPDFHFTASEIDALTAYLKYVDATTASSIR